MINLLCGDSVEMMRTMADNSVDSIVVDPPYGLSEHKLAEVTACLKAWLAGEVYKPTGKGFMGKSWDAWVPGPEVFREAIRVIKPGGHMLCFAGTRSMDLMCMAIRLSGWQLRDSIGYAHANDEAGAPLMAWVYGSGNPKTGYIKGADGETVAEGWGGSLKPAWEPIILARKPFPGTVASNMDTYGTGSLNIDACRVTTATDDVIHAKNPHTKGGFGHAGAAVYGKSSGAPIYDPSMGRWPANLIHDGSDAVQAGFPLASGARGDVTGEEPSGASSNVGNPRARVAYVRKGEASNETRYQQSGGTDFAMKPGARYKPEGSASRFFYCAKTSAADRHEGLPHPGTQFKHGSTMRDAENLGSKRGGNNHPTVKPVALMRYLVRLITPTGGHVLDFCCGSGSTGKGAEMDGFDFTGIDIDPANIEISRARIGASAPLFREFA